MDDRRLNKGGAWKLVSYRIAFRLAFVLQIIFGFFLASNPSAFSTSQEHQSGLQQPAQIRTNPIQQEQQDRAHSYEVDVIGSDHSSIEIDLRSTHK